MNLRRSISMCVPALAVSLLSAALITTPAAAAVDTGTPGQGEVDGAVSSSASNATWKDYAGGVSSRPFVTNLTATTNGVETTYVSGVTAPGQSYALPGQLTAIITPTNLCAAGQSGDCYTVPNRIGVTFAIAGADNSNMNLATSNVISADTVIDMTINMNTFGEYQRWSWLNGNMQYWQANGIGSANSLIRVRFKPTVTPFFSGSNQDANRCTATPPTCDIARPDADILAASMVLSVDDTLNEALTGAAFATQGAVFGYLEPTGTASAPILDLQMASSHETAAGTPQSGTLQAFLPANTLLNMYGVTPADASTFFTTTRSGSTGTNGTISYATWSAAAEGSDGLLVTVPQISFSVPIYQVERKSKPAKVSAAVKGGSKLALTIQRPKACKSSGAKLCVATVYLASNSFSEDAQKAGSVTLKNSSTKLTVKRRSNENYSVTFRTKKSKKLVTTAAGSVNLE